MKTDDPLHPVPRRDPLRWALAITSLAVGIAVLAVAGFVCWNLAASREVIKAQKGAATTATHEEFEKTRTWLKGEVLDKSVLPAFGKLASGVDEHGKQLEQTLDGRLGAIEKDFGQKFDAFLNKSDAQFTATLAAANQRVGEGTAALTSAARSIDVVAKSIPPAIEKAGAAIETTGNTVAALRPGFENGSLMAQNVRVALAPMLDCHDNAACLPSQTTGILGSSKTLLGESALTVRAWRKEAPKTAAAVAGIAGNGEKISRPSKLLTVVKYAAPIAGAIVAGKLAKK